LTYDYVLFYIPSIQKQSLSFFQLGLREIEDTAVVEYDEEVLRGIEDDP